MVRRHLTARAVGSGRTTSSGESSKCGETSPLAMHLRLRRGIRPKKSPCMSEAIVASRASLRQLPDYVSALSEARFRKKVEAGWAFRRAFDKAVRTKPPVVAALVRCPAAASAPLRSCSSGRGLVPMTCDPTWPDWPRLHTLTAESPAECDPGSPTVAQCHTAG